MNPLMLIRAEMAGARGTFLALALVLALALALGTGVSLSERALRQGSARAADDFDLLVGARASQVQLLLAAVYLQPRSLPLVPGTLAADIRTDPDTAWAAPLVFGDRYRKSPIVGTTPDMLTLGGKRPLAEGRVFQTWHEAVAGAGVDLPLGAEISPMHGQVQGVRKSHDHVRYRVVGRLPATGTPWDRAVLVPVGAVWAVHGLIDGHDEGCVDLPATGPLPGVSAVVVKPASVAGAYRLRARWQQATVEGENGPVNTQGVFSGEVLTELYAAMGDMRTVMGAMAFAAQCTALCGVILTACMATALRRNVLDTLRVLGAPRAYLLLLVWAVVSAAVLLGCLGGLGLGALLARGIAHAFLARTGIVLPVALGWPEVRLALLSLLLGSCCALAPALAIYRKTAAAR